MEKTAQYEIIDNFLSAFEFKEIETYIMQTNFPWHFNDGVASLEDNENYFFTHSVFGNNYIYSPETFNRLTPLINKLDIKSLIRIRLNMFTNIGKEAESASHVDQTYAHKGAIFYLNTNNGYTILEDGTRIESVANRILKFDTSKPHKATFCTDLKRRLNININYF
jgi:hypothetical protein